MSYFSRRKVQQTGIGPLRILTAMAGAPAGGAETFFVTLTLALARAGIDVATVLRPSPLRETSLRKARIPFVTAPFGRPFDVTTGSVIKRYVRAFSPGAVLAFAERASSMIPRGDYAIIGRLGGYYKLKYFRRCDHLVCITPDICRHVVAGGFPEAHVTYIPNFPAVDEAEPADRANWSTPKDAPLAVALGRLHRNKALDVLLQAAARIPGLYVWIAGEGPERAALVHLAEQLGVASRVRFLGWRTDRSSLLRAADVCVFPSRWEPNGTVVVEAWAHEVPLVTTASAGPAWIARDGEDALITPVDDAEALATAIERVLGSPDLAANMVANGKRRVASEFSEASVVLRYIALFEKLRNTKQRAA